MENKLNALEEFDVTREIQSPHLIQISINSISKQRIAQSILSRSKEDVLLVNPSGFEVDAVLAGLNEGHIEYFAQNAPKEYKSAILSVLGDISVLDSAYKITKEMDASGGAGSSNQKRFINVIQYLKNNQAAFKF